MTSSHRKDVLRHVVVRLGLVGFVACGILGPSVSIGTARPTAATGACAASTAAAGPRVYSTPARGRTLKGAVRVRRGQAGWLIRAPLGRRASYVSQSFRASEAVTVKFCLHAPRGAATRVARLDPGGVSVDLRSGHLQLRVARSGHTQSASHRLTVTGRSTVVQLAVDGDGKRVDVYADGVEQASFVGSALAPNRVALGSLVRARTSSILLTGVTVTTCRGRVIPAASRPGTATTCRAQGGAAGTTTASPSSPPRGSTAGPAGTGSASSGTTPSSTAAAACVTGSGKLAPSQWPANPFAPTSFWNAPLAPNAPLDASSAAYVTELLRQVKSYGPWMNTTSYSAPVYVVPGDEPVQHVTLDMKGPDLQAALDAVPVPCDAKAAAGSDAQMVVWQPATDRMWEFWKMQKESDGWHAGWGGEMDSVSTDPGYFDHFTSLSSNWGATGTGLPLLGGLVTAADLQRGYINHALSIGLVQTEPKIWSWPAQRTDGSDWTPGIIPIPEGTRFRLDPTLNIGSLNLPPIDRMLAQAAQKYGIVVRDKAGTVAFYGQDPNSLTSNPWPAAFGNQYANNVLKLFPWSHLQALQTQLSCCWSPSF